MAVSVRNCLGVDIGSQWLRVAEMEIGKTGPRVVALAEAPLALDPALNENQRNQAIAKQLNDLLKANKIRTRKAVFAVPGQTVFVRQFSLPKTSPERLKRMVSFEARQRVPFPLDKTIMEFQVFESSAATEVNVLLVAIKRDYIVNFMRLVRRTGLTPLAISVSSIALYNFYELNSSKRDLTPGGRKVEKKKKPKPVKKKKLKKGEAPPAADEELPEGLEGLDESSPLEEMGFEEIQAYVNLGASLMDLAIPKPGNTRMIGFTRSVPLAGNEMDRAVREKTGVDDVLKARAIKEQQAVVLSTDFEIDGDPEKVNMPASEAVTGIVDRIVSELRRSLDFYISQPDGVAVDSIVLSGGLARLRYLAGYIEEKMGVPVSLGEPAADRLRMPDNAPDPFAPYAAAVGLALQGLGAAQNSINFLPEDIKSMQGLQSRRKEIFAMGAMLLVMIGMSWDVASGRISAYRNANNQMAADVAKSQQESSKIVAAKSRDSNVAAAYAQLAEAGTGQMFWLDFLKKVVDSHKADILAEEIICRTDGNVIIKGKTATPANVTLFVEDLKKISEGAVPATGDNPKGNFPVWMTAISQVRDNTFNTETVQEFTIVVKTYMQLRRIRTIGGQPVNSPPNAAVPGGAIAPVRF